MILSEMKAVNATDQLPITHKTKPKVFDLNYKAFPDLAFALAVIAPQPRAHCLGQICSLSSSDTSYLLLPPGCCVFYSCYLEHVLSLPTTFPSLHPICLVKS